MAVQSIHTEDHHDHADPAEELQRLLDAGDVEERAWEAPGGKQWVVEHGEDDEGEPIVSLTLLSPDYEFVCQAYAPR